EPTAAALDVCYSCRLNNGKYLVISTGVYTFEASVVHVQNRLIETKAVRGAQFLSGHATTAKLVEGVQQATNARGLDRLHVQVDRAKKDIDSSGGAIIDVDGNRFEIDRKFAGEWLAGQKQVMSELFTTLLSQSQTKHDEISGIILSGSPAKSWLLDELLSER